MKIDHILGEKGLFEGNISNYEIRQQQIDLAKHIESCLASNSSLVAEAPCGVGKSYAYLIPAIIHSNNTGERVVVSTANIALQEQLFSKDIPFIVDLLKANNLISDSFKFSILKGRNNYLCLDMIDEIKRLDLWKAFDEDEKNLIFDMLNWPEEENFEETMGDKSTLSFDPPASIWNLFSVGDGECKKKFCPYFLKCCSNKAKIKSSESNLIVCNYHLLFADMYIKSIAKRGVLPEFNILICDEAHNIEEIARDCFSDEIRPKNVKSIINCLEKAKNKTKLNPYRNDKKIEKLIKSLNKNNDSFFKEIIDYYKKFDENEYTRTKEKDIVEYNKICLNLLEASEILDSFYNKLESTMDIDSELFLSKSKEAKRLSVSIEKHITQPDNNSAYWIKYSEFDKGHNVALYTKPIYVQDYLREFVWSNVKSIVALSATMTVSGSSNSSNLDELFQFIIESIGLDKDINKFVCNSPFDFIKQCGLIVPHDIPDPIKGNEDSYRELFLKNIKNAIEIAEGRTMILFTSYSHLNHFHNNCNDIKGKYRFFVQGSGEMNRTKMIEEFKKDKNSVLLGTASFWEGVDIPGESLSLLVIDKLPFPNIKQDPVLDAMQEKNNRFFIDEYTPRAILALKQGFGRLIRTKSDKGCVVICDRRILPNYKNYSNRFLKSLPIVPFSNNIDNIKDLLYS